MEGSLFAKMNRGLGGGCHDGNGTEVPGAANNQVLGCTMVDNYEWSQLM